MESNQRQALFLDLKVILFDMTVQFVKQCFDLQYIAV